MLLKEERELIVEYGKRMALEKITPGTSGNISIYNREKKLMAISPSGIDYLKTTVEDIVIMDLDANIIEGNRKPSSEWELHSALYREKSSCNSVVHTHSMYCSVFSALREPLRATHYVIADSGAMEIPCAEYERFGTKKLAQSAVRAIGDCDAVLLANHGVLTCGKTIKSAYSLVKNLEYCAEVEYRARSIGKPYILSKDQMQEVLEGFKIYGQQSK